MKTKLIILHARFCRWLYLLFGGMWRGECAYDSRHGPHLVLVGVVRKTEKPPGWVHWEFTRTFYNPLNFKVVMWRTPK